MVEREFLRINGDDGSLSAKLPLFQAAMDLFRGYGCTCWARTSSKRVQFNGLFGTRDLQGIDQSHEDRIVGPETAVDEGIEVSLVPRGFDGCNGPVNRSGAGGQAHVNE